MDLHPGILNTWLLLLLYHMITWTAYILAGNKRRSSIETPDPPQALRSSGRATMALSVLMIIVSIIIPMSRGVQLSAGLLIYGTGLGISLSAILSFMHLTDGLNTAGMYRFSRNPMYVGSFLAFTGTAVCGFRGDPQNAVFLALLLAWAISIHRTVAMEESLLSSIHGEKFERYRSEVPRYFII